MGVQTNVRRRMALNAKSRSRKLEDKVILENASERKN